MAEAESELIGGVSHGVQRHQVRDDPGRGVRREQWSPSASHHDAVPGWMVEGPVAHWLGWLWLLLKTLAVACGIHLGTGHVPQAAHRPAAVLRVEVPAAGEPDQPVCHGAWRSTSCGTTPAHAYHRRSLGIMTGINIALFVQRVFSSSADLVRGKVRPVEPQEPEPNAAPTLPPRGTITGIWRGGRLACMGWGW